MLVSFVLRLDSSRAAAGVLVGQVEAVATGATTVIRGVPDLLAFCAQHAPAAHSPTEEEHHV